MKTTEQIVNEKVEAFRLQLLKELVKPEFEVGKWYKIKYKEEVALINYQIKNNYGFGFLKDWVNDFIIYGAESPISFELATESEVLEALTKEAVKRGLAQGVTMLDSNKELRLFINNNSYALSNSSRNVLLLCNYPIFDNGKWATVIPKEKTSDDWMNDVKASFFSDTSKLAYTDYVVDYLKQNNLSITKNK